MRVIKLIISGIVILAAYVAYLNYRWGQNAKSIRNIVVVNLEDYEDDEDTGEDVPDWW